MSGVGSEPVEDFARDGTTATIMRLQPAYTAAILGAAADACIRLLGAQDDPEDCEWQSYAMSNMNADSLRGSSQAFPPPEELTAPLTVKRGDDVMTQFIAAPFSAR